MTALGYRDEDFQRYFGAAYFRLPKGIATIQGLAKKGVWRFNLAGNAGFEDVPSANIAWGMTQPNSLGYRHMKHGQMLVYVTKRPGRNTSKGVSRTTLRVKPVLEISMCFEAAGHVQVYTQARENWAEIAGLLYDPEFAKPAEAMQALLSDRTTSLGFALSPDLAIVVDPLADNELLLLSSERSVGRYAKKDGWTFINDDVRSAAKRVGLVE